LETPIVEWQFIVMKQNEHEIPAAERMAKQIGVDVLRFGRVGMPFDTPDRKATAEEWFPTRVQGIKETTQQFGEPDIPLYSPVSRDKRSWCFYLYRSLFANPDGGVSPCCVAYKKEWDFAQLPASDMHALWNNDFYQSGRSLFSPKNAPRMLNTICDGCGLFGRYKKQSQARGS
jgi:MoaA/NifB/PqqE/SkfB family radical SAM enzyme